MVKCVSFEGKVDWGVTELVWQSVESCVELICQLFGRLQQLLLLGPHGLPLAASYVLLEGWWAAFTGVEKHLWLTIDHLDPPDLPRHGCNSDRGPATDRSGERSQRREAPAKRFVSRWRWLYYMDAEDCPARPEIQQPLTEWSNWRGSESSTLETVYFWRYAL